MTYGTNKTTCTSDPIPTALLMSHLHAIIPIILSLSNSSGYNITGLLAVTDWGDVNLTLLGFVSVGKHDHS